MKILFATDGSEHARLAEALLMMFPGASKADIHVVSVSPTPTVFGGLFQPMAETTYLAESTEVWASLKQRSRRIMDESCQRLKEKGLKGHAVVLEGDPGSEILKYANDQMFDLVFLGSRGENALAAVLLGSVARKLLSHSKSSVLVARHFADQTAEQSRAVVEKKRKLDVLLATDDSQGSHAAIDFVASLGTGVFGDLSVLSIEPLIVINTIYDPVITPIEIDPLEVDSRKFAEQAKDQLKNSADNVVAEHSIGRPGNIIQDSAKNHKADLVVLGASGHGAIDRLILGSVSYEVATTAPCSVLVVRPK